MLTRRVSGTWNGSLGGRSGLAVSAIGLDQPIREVGTLREDVAWSTIKVPIALAIETRAAGQPSPSEQSLLARALTASDNAAAESLWGGLGAPSEAAAAVQGILTRTGDTSTRVETRVLRPGFTSFGQTQWSLAAQQRFIAGLPCLPHAAPVLALMQQVIPDQRWGLGSLGAEARRSRAGGVPSFAAAIWCGRWESSGSTTVACLPRQWRHCRRMAASRLGPRTSRRSRSGSSPV